MRRALLREDGIAIPTALIVTLILFGLAMAASAVAITGLNQASRDREVKRALGAADAGVEVALYRMNRAIVSGDLTGLLGQSGLTTQALRELGCVDASVSGVTLINLAQTSWCTAQNGTTEVLQDNASYTYWTKSGVTVAVGTLPSNVASLLANGTSQVVKRTIVSVGTSRGVKRRVLAVALLALNSSGGSLALWKQMRWVECPPTYTGAQDSGCPSTGL